MGRTFKLPRDFKTAKEKLEKILPRIMSRMSTKTYGIIPSSVVAFYKEVVNSGDLVFKCGMFKGKLRKLLFSLDPIESKSTPKYQLKVNMGIEHRSIKIETRKLSHIMNIDIDIPDGTIIEVRQIAEDVTLKNVHVTALIDFDQNQSLTKEFITDELIKDLDNEGI